MLGRSPGRTAQAPKPNKTNPIAVIQNQVQLLHAEQEKTESDIMSLEQEKQSILQILPKVFYELEQLREKIEANSRELAVYDNAIEEIERNYGDFIFSAEMFAQEE